MVIKKILLTPGPATTTDSVKNSQIVSDICPREKEFGDVMKSISRDLIKISRSGTDDKEYECVLFGGSGTAVMDSVISSVIPENEKVLIINNGAYGKRFVDIAKTYLINYQELIFNWDEVIDISRVEGELRKDKQIKHVVAVHHETTTGILNPVKEIGEVAKKYNCGFIVDSISSFAGVLFDIKECNIDFMVSTSNKCIQGMPGISFIICKKSELEKIKNYSKKSFYLNLYEQHDYLIKKNQMRFTPSIQTVYALRKAIDELFEEGIKNRVRRYMENNKLLVDGMEKLGFKQAISKLPQSFLLTTFLEPKNINYSFDKMHDLLYEKGFTIYPGKIKEDTFRLANIGSINSEDINNFLNAMEQTLNEMSLKLGGEKTKEIKPNKEQNIAIILAAGSGSRYILGDTPKSLFELNQKSLLEHSLEALSKKNIKRVVLAVGHNGDKIRQKIGDNFGDIRVEYVENPIYNETGSMHSLFLALEKLKENEIKNCLVLDGDIIYNQEILNEILNHEKEDIVILSKITDSGDEVYVCLDESNNVINLGKQIDKQNPKIKNILEFIGISKFSKQFIDKMMELHKDNLKNNILEEYYEDCANRASKYLAWHGLKTDYRWAEIDKKQDIQKALGVLRSFDFSYKIPI